MSSENKQKILKTLLSLLISFLIIFIVAMFARTISNTILPENNKVAVLINDYLDMMVQMVDNVAISAKIKRNSVSEYQVNLITQSISDYVGYSMYKTAEVVKNYNPNIEYGKRELSELKNAYYKMTLENPYLRSMTVFTTDGNMRLNLYLSKTKSWPIELQDGLIKEVLDKGSLVLNATNENAFYIMEHIKNRYGDMIVATRNDYSYVADIAMYYQVADKRLYVSDSRNLVYNVREAIGDNSIEKVSSVINRFAYYKKQPSFMVNDSLSVSMIGKEYPNYFELIVLAITALLILLFQLAINGIIKLIKNMVQIKNNQEYVETLHKNSNPKEIKNIDEKIVNADIPTNEAYEDMPPIIQKLEYNIPDEYHKEMERKKHHKFNVEKEILNIVSNIKEEIDNQKVKKEDITSYNEIINNNEEEQTEISTMKIDDYIEENYDDGIQDILKEELKDSDILYNAMEESETSSEEREIEEIVEDNIYTFNEEDEKTTLEEENNIIENTPAEEYIYNNYDDSNEENIEEIVYNNIEENVEEEINNDNHIISENISNDAEDIKYSIKSEVINNNDMIQKEAMRLSSYKNKEETLNKEYARNIFKKNDNVDKNILDSYNKSESKQSEISKTEDIFAAFDKMLSSIITKVEEDTKKSIGKDNK